VVLKTASPGVPDFYQGSELWDLSLVDPDNRRPVDYALRSEALEAMLQKAEVEGKMAVCREVMSSLYDGRIKLWTTHCALALRAEMPELFRRGEYLPLNKDDGHAQHVIAFLRRYKDECVLAIVPRFACTLMHQRPELPLGRAWGSGKLIVEQCAGQRLVNVFTGEDLIVSENGEIPLAQAFAHFPVLLAVQAGASRGRSGWSRA
jgi:(1->4)-alpha-D-glucan 1-alpha-D-glucosylmutase